MHWKSHRLQVRCLGDEVYLGAPGANAAYPKAQRCQAEVAGQVHGERLQRDSLDVRVAESEVLVDRLQRCGHHRPQVGGEITGTEAEQQREVHVEQLVGGGDGAALATAPATLDVVLDPALRCEDLVHLADLALIKDGAMLMEPLVAEIASR